MKNAVYAKVKSQIFVKTDILSF